MGLTADEWHILSICVLPLISAAGITASIFISSANNRTLLAMGVIFSAGVLLSASLVHMLPHATETLDEYFAKEDVHDDHDDTHFTEFGHEAHDDDRADHEDHNETSIAADAAAVDADDPDDDHSGHDHVLRLLRLLQEDDHDDEDAHAGHNHAFPWAQTFFAMAFLVLLMIEAALERFIDVHFSGKRGNFFHSNEEEEIIYAEGFAAEQSKVLKVLEELQQEEQQQQQGENKSMSQAGTEAERAELVDEKDIVATTTTTTIPATEENGTKEAKVQLHDYGCTQEHGPNQGCTSGPTPGHHGHNHDHAAAATAVAVHGNGATAVNKEQPAPVPGAQVDLNKDSGLETELETDDSAKEDTQPVAKPPGPEANIKIPFPDCKDCQLSAQVPLPDCVDCKILTREELGYEDEGILHRHHHHNNHLHKRVSAKSNEASDIGPMGSASGSQIPIGMFGSGGGGSQARRRNSGTSNVSGKSSVWAKTAGRPSVVSYAVAPPQNEPEQQQTINPWVSILLTLVLSIHVILEGLTIGSSQDVDTIQSTFVAVAAHKGFASFSLGSSLVASGYWEGNRTMFFVLAGVFVAVDIISIGIGMGLSSVFEQNGDVAGAVLQSLLGGSFLFVATVELIPGELEKMRRHNLPLLPILMSLCAGFALMTMLAKWGV